MRISRSWCLLALAALGPLGPTSISAGADTTSPSIPASLFPSGSRITYQPDLSNAEMDRSWNFDAAGNALMHSYPQDQFERQSGWMEKAFLQRGRRLAWFVVYESRYGVFQDGHRGNVTAYENLKMMLRDWWHAPLAANQPPGLLPDGPAGENETRIIPKEGDGPYVVISAWWGDDREVEAVAFASPRLIGMAKLQTMLARQIRYAVRLP